MKLTTLAVSMLSSALLLIHVPAQAQCGTACASLMCNGTIPNPQCRSSGQLMSVNTDRMCNSGASFLVSLGPMFQITATGSNAAQCTISNTGRCTTMFVGSFGSPMTRNFAATGVTCMIDGTDGLPVELLEFAVDEDQQP